MDENATKAFDEAMQQANTLLNRGDAEEALTQVRSALKIQPGDPHAQNLMGLTYFLQGEFELAANIFSALCSRVPNDPTLQVNAGLSYFHISQLEKAQEHLQRAIGLNHQHKRAYAYLGLLHIDQDDLELARAAFLEAGLSDFAETIFDKKLSRSDIEKVVADFDPLGGLRFTEVDRLNTDRANELKQQAQGVDLDPSEFASVDTTETNEAANLSFDEAEEEDSQELAPKRDVPLNVPIPDAIDKEDEEDKFEIVKTSDIVDAEDIKREKTDNIVQLASVKEDREQEKKLENKNDKKTLDENKSSEEIENDTTTHEQEIDRAIVETEDPTEDKIDELTEEALDEALLRQQTSITIIDESHQEKKEQDHSDIDERLSELLNDHQTSHQAFLDKEMADAIDASKSTAKQKKKKRQKSIPGVISGEILPAPEKEKKKRKEKTKKAQTNAKKNIIPGQIDPKRIEEFRDKLRIELQPLNDANLADHHSTVPTIAGLLGNDALELKKKRLYLRYGKWLKKGDSDPKMIVRSDQIVLLQGLLERKSVKRRRHAEPSTAMRVDGATFDRLSGDGLAIVAAFNESELIRINLNKSDVLFAHENTVLAYSASLSWENGYLSDDYPLMRFTGEGPVILSAKTISSCPITPDSPIDLSFDYLLGWIGDLNLFEHEKGRLSCKGQGSLLLKA